MAKERAFGTKILIRPVGSSTWNDIAQVKDISGPSMSKETIDVTTHDSADSWIERLSGLKGGGAVSFEIEWDHVGGGPTPYAVLQAAFNDVGVNYELAIMSPGGKVIGFASAVANEKCWRMAGTVTKIEPSFPVGGSLRQSFEFTVTGPVTRFTAA